MPNTCVIISIYIKIMPSKYPHSGQQDMGGVSSTQVGLTSPISWPTWPVFSQPSLGRARRGANLGTKVLQGKVL